jgi:hypothetical protein
MNEEVRLLIEEDINHIPLQQSLLDDIRNFNMSIEHNMN